MTAVQAASDVAANSGRWVKRTEKSAAALKTNQLMKGSEPGFRRLVTMKDGKISGILEIAKAPTQMLTVPAALTSIAGIMTQAAMPQSLDEISDFLATIDEKVDDILRAQKDAVLAELIEVGLIIDEAMTTRDSVGRVSDITWSKLQSSSLAIASTQACALRQLDAPAVKFERKSSMGDLAKTTQEIEPKAKKWVAVLARCFQHQDAFSVIELDRVLDASPDESDGHRRGLRAARQKRLEQITSSTGQLIERMNAAAGYDNARVLLHPTTARAVVHASNRDGWFGRHDSHRQRCHGPGKERVRPSFQRNCCTHVS